MSALFDLLPLVAFFVAFKLGGIYVATAVLIGVSVAQVAWTWLRTRTLARMPLVAAGLAVVLGGATLALHDERYIKWKVSVVYGAFAIAFLASNLFGDKPLWQRALDEQFRAPRAVWVRLNTAWGLFFLALAGLNAWVLTRFDTETWVNFKVWGVLVALLAFTVLQVLYLAKHGEMKEP
jgi:intracellular septation protein